MRSSLCFRWLPVAALIVAHTGCRPVNTVPAPVAPDAAVQELQLEIPADLEVRNVDFSASLYSDVSGTQDLVGSAVGGRGFVKVYALDRKSGEAVLLLYESVAKRKRPVQVIRFRPTTSP